MLRCGQIHGIDIQPQRYKSIVITELSSILKILLKRALNR